MATVQSLDELILKEGSHSRRGKESVCLMEAVAWVAGEKHSDRPQCVSPVLSAFGRAWNDGMRSDEEREQLKQYIPQLIGTAGDPDADERRAWMATDWLVRVYTPAWLRLAGLSDQADTLAALQPIANAAYAASVQGELDRVAGAASAARSAARSAAASAARSAAASAAWSAAWSAARSAAESAAESALEPTTRALQRSAHDLYGRLIRAEEIPAEWPALVIAEAVPA